MLSFAMIPTELYCVRIKMEDLEMDFELDLEWKFKLACNHCK
ncbi:hypothetical protein DOY81_012265, partial [Sarcophaga bullata]